MHGQQNIKIYCYLIYEVKNACICKWPKIRMNKKNKGKTFDPGDALK